MENKFYVYSWTALALENGTDMLFRNVAKYQPTLSNIP
jgi:hypothetical protein